MLIAVASDTAALGQAALGYIALCRSLDQPASMSTRDCLRLERQVGVSKYALFAHVTECATVAASTDIASRTSLTELQLLAHWSRGSASRFTQIVTQRIEVGPADMKPYLMLAMAYRDEIAGEQNPQPLAGLMWIDRAIAAAESDEARCDCLEYLIIRHVWARDFNEASSALAACEASFAQQKDRFAELKEWIQVRRNSAAHL